MKHLKSLLAILLLLTCGLTLCSCQRGEGETTDTIIYYTVSFNTNGGEAIQPQTVASGTHVEEPAVPLREGFLFDGWRNGAINWDFSADVVTADLILTANWIDATAVFEYERIGQTDTARIAKLKNPLPRLTVPSVIGGYRVTELGDGLFADLDVLDVQSIHLPPTVTTIGEEAFYNCTEIEISFDDRAVLTSIGAGAFYRCDGLSSIRLGEGLPLLDVDTFFGCSSLKELRIPKSVAVLEENALADCGALKTLMLHSTLTEIRDSALKDCDALKTLFFYGTEEEIKTLREDHTEPQNNAFLNATVYLYAEAKPQETGTFGCWYLDENDKPRIW